MKDLRKMGSGHRYEGTLQYSPMASNKAIGDHIISGCDTELCLTIPRYTLYNLCQRKEQKPSKYKALLEKLKAFNIYLTIEKREISQKQYNIIS